MVISNILFSQKPASATFLPGFGKNVIGKATKLNEFTAPAALTIVLLCISLILVTFVLNEADCSPLGKWISHTPPILCICAVFSRSVVDVNRVKKGARTKKIRLLRRL